MGELRDRMRADLTIGNYSRGTIKLYLMHARRFARYFMRSPTVLGGAEIREYLLWLAEECRLSPSTMKIARASLRFLYGVTLQRPTEVAWIPVPRVGKRLPAVLSGTEVERLLSALRLAHMRVLVTTLYAAGLRVSEGCCLRPSDIDSLRMVIRVVGKGNKERYTLLSPRLLEELRAYWRAERPSNGWLFPGRTSAGHVSAAAVQEAVHSAALLARLNKRVTPHMLRHSFATHLIESGVDVTLVQALLGHQSVTTTQVYLHVRAETLARISSPLDLLGTPAGAVLG